MALTKVKLIADGTIVQSHLNASHGITTADIGEGSNLYYTDARARAAVSVSGNALSYNSSTGVITSNFEENPVFTTGVTVANDSGHFTLFRTDGVTQLGKLYDDSGFTIEGKANNNLILRTKANSLGEGIKFQDTSSNDLMFIDGTNGQVGIGTTSPTSKLHIYSGTAHGEIRLTTATSSGYDATMSLIAGQSGGVSILNLGYNGDDDYTRIFRTGSGDLRFDNNNAPRMLINSSGNIGIGTTSPSSKLHSVVTTAGDSALKLQDDTGSVFDFQCGISGVTGDALLIKDTTLSYDYLTLRGGNVGIGVSPSDLLHLKKSSGDAALRIETVTGGDPTIYFNSSAANRSGLIRYQDNGTNMGRIEYVHNGDRLAFQAGSATGETMSIINGAVGIGITSPASKLDINGGRIGIRNNIVAASNLTYSTIYSTENTGAAYPFTGVSGNLVVEPRNGQDFVVLGTSGVARMVVKGGGNVGIGTSSPSAKLDILQGSASPVALEINTENTFCDVLMNSFYSTSATRLRVGTNDFQIHTNGGQNLTVTSGGDVGIGTTSPIAQLDVSGNTNQHHSASTTHNGGWRNIQNLGATGWLDQTYSAGRIKVFGYENSNVNVSYCEYYVIRHSGGYSLNQIGTRLDRGNSHGHVEVQISGNYLQVRNVAQSSLGAVRIVFSGMKD